MRSLKSLLAIFFGVCIASSAFAYYNPEKRPVQATDRKINFREACTTAGKQIDLAVNNVRARLLTGGDIWWDQSSNGKYVVPAVEPGQQEVSSIFSGAVWLGGFEVGSNVLKVACQTYGNSSGNSDFWAGPLRANEGTTDKPICDDWDRFFVVTREDIRASIDLYEAAQDGGEPYTEEMIPRSLKEWPGDNSPYFFDALGFDLPKVAFGYKNFYDRGEDGDYDPLDGDFPAIIIRGCDEPQFPDEMIYWIYNDEGGGALHGETNGEAIRMEVQVQAFAYSTNDQINDMTFYRYRLNNRAVTDLDSTYFAMWVDADLGCYSDDYIGCDTLRSLAYTYNADAIDGSQFCTQVGTYGEDVPIIGIDYFRGPLDEFRNELGMSAFTYFNNPSVGGPPAGTTDPETGPEFYNYLSGRWKDGTPFTFGGSGYNPNTTNPEIDFAFISDPDESAGPDVWSMCEPGTGFPDGLPQYDRRTVQSSGPFLLQRGAVNELIVGAVWVPELLYPCPSISRLQDADDLAQDLFDNCFELLDGPSAPDVDWIELDRELIAVFTNDESSNNFNEEYEQAGIGFPLGAEDTTYNFQGYLLYQLSGPEVRAGDFDDPEKARLIYQVDFEDGIGTLYNWESVPNPTAQVDPNAPEDIFFPVEKVEGLDDGIRHTFKITTDQFARGDDSRLLNHRKYYFLAIAYAHNNFADFDPFDLTGQKVTYFPGRLNIGKDGAGTPYAPIPRPIVDVKLNSDYGDGPIVTRLDGVGVGGNFVDMNDETRSAIADGSFDGSITYEPGRAPINVSVFNPLTIVDGEYELTFIDENMDNDRLDDNVRWQLTSLADGNVILSDKTIDGLNEQIIGEYGFTVSIGQTADVGDWADETDGGIGAEIDYADLEKPFWLSGVPPGFSSPDIAFSAVLFDYVQYRDAWDERNHQNLADLGPGYFVPYQVCRTEDPGLGGGVPFYITPAWRDYGGDARGGLVYEEDRLNDLNNVDIVFTNDKSLWSRCVIVETMPKDYVILDPLAQAGEIGVVRTEDGEIIYSPSDFNHPTEPEPGIYYTPGDGKEELIAFDLKARRSVSKDAGADGNPAPEILTEQQNSSLVSYRPQDFADSQEPLIGMGWFPGYAIDVETGKRKNVFFGENSAYRESTGYLGSYDTDPNGDDMMFNPNSQVVLKSEGAMTRTSPLFYYAGGHHFVYVTSEDYDSCAYHYDKLHPRKTNLQKVNALKRITWAGIPVMETGTQMLSYEEGLIPNEVTYKLRVDNPYEVETGTGQFNGYPTYRFSFTDKEAEELDEAGVENALDMINVVPNPYYAYSDYEDSRLSQVVKITNLPAKCVVTIYSLDGKFIRRYNRDEQPGAAKGDAIPSAQVLPDLDWDLKNSRGIPIASGIYLIHVDSEIGERTLKWFGVNRKFDPSGL